MGSLMSEGNFHAKRKRAISELVEGKKMAARLQTLLQNRVQEDDRSADVSAQELAVQIVRSFSVTLSVVSSCTESAQIAAVDCGGDSRKKLKPGVVVKDRRGCYKRRKTKDSWVIVSSTMEDGCAWRKYGQKSILNSEFPRCYYRCTHKYEGCKATKQVQRIKEDPLTYQTTYMSHHTCTETQRAPPHVAMLLDDSDPMESANLISFQSKKPDRQNFPTSVFTPSVVKQESKENTPQTTDEDLSESKSMIHKDTMWQNTSIGVGPLEQKPAWTHPIMNGPYVEEDQAAGSGFDRDSCESSTIFDGLDCLEVNQFADIWKTRW
ncbi:hypothetical protein ABFS82_06G056400 [Erythranthe guttata]|uniref:WRKY domain-containing protein n=1 Tax=Erythranthe guttata TaxID=4155 RepID=A0A022PZ11_ERYGU|nr:PREDICTED: probable WRKY transcription factor 70 [Erythranthe guttata]EYU20128.1 hypothetical protein MIMGU_mgv1a010128mg [Erythranthe guttata]|eukprot:XP_012858191.1 PREDICTED: probable WRKY transcription factor 70 [Erythranthe guttata]